MTDQSWLVDCRIEDEAERKIVRRFTNELNGDTELERDTKQAQQNDDEDEQISFETRALSYLDEKPPGYSQANFNIAETARKELGEMYEEIVKEDKTSKLAQITARFMRPKKSAKASANEMIADSECRDFAELKELIEGQQKRWKGTYGVVYQNFERLCKTLDAHKKVFGIFPSQNMYAQVFCGSLALIVEAVVNNDAIAEMLSRSVTEISTDASQCAELVEFIKTSQMREQLSNVYAQVFRFYRNALEWFIKPKVSKFVGSFNAKIKKNFEEAVSDINKSIERMYKQCHIRGVALLHTISQDAAASKNELFRQRQAPEKFASDPGESMQELFKALIHGQTIEFANAGKTKVEISVKVLVEGFVSPGGSLTRDMAREVARHLGGFVIGDEGHALFESGRLWTPRGGVAPKLHAWMSVQGDSQGRTLWISSPADHGTTSAKAAAMNAVIAAWQVKAPIISHFCERPRLADEGQSPEEAGLTGLMYSLILQLLQFKVVGENFGMEAESLRRLNGSKEMFENGLEVLQSLLAATPVVTYCVINDINCLEWGNGAKWCNDLLSILFQHQTNNAGAFNILLATSGQSRVLLRHVANKDRFFAGLTARQILRMT